MCRRAVVLGLGTVLAASVTVAAPSSVADETARSTIDQVGPLDERATVPGHYVVVMDRRAGAADRAAAVRQARAGGGRISFQYGAALQGFAARLPAQAVEALRRNPTVQYVEPDVEFSASGLETGAPWGLDRIDQRSLPLNRKYRYAHTGAGVTAYIIDTGIRKRHTQFGGRVRGGFTSVDDGRGTSDCNGHGTHVAGTVGSTRFGVAKQVALRPVRVLDCRGAGRTSGVIAGVDWVTAHHVPGAPAVANMSLGGAASPALDAAVRNSILDGVTYSVAAGNESDDACRYSPARVGAAVTVGATTMADARASFSNTGLCLDLFAPGQGIKSTWSSGNTATKTLSGTSMAAPHVAGVAALLLEQRPAATPDVVLDTLRRSAVRGAVAGRGTGSPNLLLYARGTVQAPPVSNDLIDNGGFERGADSAGWSASPDVITDEPAAPAHRGSWKAWLNGYGRQNVDSITQSVTIPPGAESMLHFYLRVVTEKRIGTAHDRLQVSVTSDGTSIPLATYSNLDAGDVYVRRSFDMSTFAGRTITLRWTGTEDSDDFSTSFLIDNVSMTTPS